jgi:hypothetical protein
MQQQLHVAGSSEDSLVSLAATADVNAGRDSGSDGGSNSSVSDQQGEQCWLSGAVGSRLSDRPPAGSSRNLAVVDLYAEATPADTTPPESSAGGSGGSSTSGGSSSGGAQGQQDVPQGQHQQAQLQPQMAPHHVADELFDMGLLPGYVQQELAGLGVDELNTIMVRPRLVLWLWQICADVCYLMLGVCQSAVQDIEHMLGEHAACDRYQFLVQQHNVSKMSQGLTEWPYGLC